jgi:hypothetical protein
MDVADEFLLVKPLCMLATETPLHQLPRRHIVGCICLYDCHAHLNYMYVPLQDICMCDMYMYM